MVMDSADYDERRENVKQQELDKRSAFVEEETRAMMMEGRFDEQLSIAMESMLNNPDLSLKLNIWIVTNNGAALGNEILHQVRKECRATQEKIWDSNRDNGV